LDDDAAAQVEERRRGDLAVRHKDPDTPILFDDELAFVAIRLDHCQGCGQAGCDLLKFHLFGGV
jgi:hypothetical protein